MSLNFIGVLDLSSEKDEKGRYRRTSLSYSDKTPNTLTVMGNLPHGAKISFDKIDAQKLIDYLQKNIIEAE